MLAPESAQAFIEVEFPNSQGRFNFLGSPFFIGNPSMMEAEHSLLSIMVDYFFSSFWFVIISLVNLGSLDMDFKNGALNERDNTCSMNFFWSGSSGFGMGRYG